MFTLDSIIVEFLVLRPDDNRDQESGHPRENIFEFFLSLQFQP